jgi:5'-3' exonuclease
MPKTLTGAELQLDDSPVRDAELFLVDGNNLAYRAFFALPEELATTEGFPTNALLGFTNMLFKLLSDYKPKGVAVAWDTRPAERLEVASDYKADRRPTFSPSSSRSSARSWRLSGIATSSSRAGRPMT